MNAPSHVYMYGATPVPWTVSWSGEGKFWLGPCEYSGRTAIMQNEAPYEGRPIFNKPHAIRQRRCIAKGLCDLCGKPLATATKVSLSDARPVAHAHKPLQVLQVEPLLHKRCALVSLRHCPALRRKIEAGEQRVRQVLRSSVQFAVMDMDYVEAITGTKDRTAIGHAKVELQAFRDRDIAWLEGRP